MNARTNGLNDLEIFLNTAKTVRADFSQTTQAPARASDTSSAPRTPLKRSLQGSFDLSRPNLFKFHYKAPFEQVIVSDGQTLWVHDVDLNQVTRRKLSVAMAFAPALMVASAKNIAALNRIYDLEAMPTIDAIRWVRATPRPRANGEAASDAGAGGLGGPVQRVELGFRGDGAIPQLAQLVIVDLNGQRTAMSFDKVQTNVAIPAGAFNFKPPATAEVMGQ